jgi:hypothetical protein
VVFWNFGIFAALFKGITRRGRVYLFVFIHFLSLGVGRSKALFILEFEDGTKAACVNILWMANQAGNQANDEKVETPSPNIRQHEYLKDQVNITDASAERGKDKKQQHHQSWRRYREAKPKQTETENRKQKQTRRTNTPTTTTFRSSST